MLLSMNALAPTPFDKQTSFKAENGYNPLQEESNLLNKLFLAYLSDCMTRYMI